MGKLWVGILLLVAILGTFLLIKSNGVKQEKAKEGPLLKYAFENLKNTKIKPSSIVFGDVIKNNEDYISRMFYFKLKNIMNEKNNDKKVSGLINIPAKEGTYPIIVMLRGFVPPSSYSPGVGTQRVGEFFAQNGFITLAPDFLDYGDSDKGSADPMENRFQTYATVLSLLSSLGNLNTAFEARPPASSSVGEAGRGKVKADISKIGIWGHSNGGQIAASALEITGKNYPTVLWAPVSKPFPYSILYFTDDIKDHGKALRKVVADFENDYDIELYSPSNFYSWINAPLQIHQGAGDDAVPLEWSDNFVSDLMKLDKDVTYFTYPGADHNLMPDWDEAVRRSLDFYKSHLGLH